MFIEFELKGSQLLHKGIFETTGFWVKFDAERCDITKEALSYKIYSHFSFTFEHQDFDISRKVFNGLALALRGEMWEDTAVGFIRPICNDCAGR